MFSQDNPQKRQPNKLTKAQRIAGRHRMELYHQKKLAELMVPVRQAIDAFDRGEIDAFSLDHTLKLYIRQSRELYSFVNSYYGSNSKLPILLSLIDTEERGEEVRSPKTSEDHTFN